MSLLEEICLKKIILKPTVTKVTTPDGQVFREDSKGSDRRLLGKGPGYVVDTKPDLGVAHVIQGLCMGSQDVVQSLDLLRAHHITHVLSLGVEVEHFEAISYTYIPVLDLPEFNLRKLFGQCFALIDAIREEGGTILVHCNAGISRSASIVIGNRLYSL